MIFTCKRLVPISHFHSANLKEILEPIQNYEDVPFLDPKWSICSEHIFLYKPLLSLSSNCCPFHCAKFKKIPTVDQDLQGCAIFGPRMVHLPHTILFLENY